MRKLFIYFPIMVFTFLFIGCNNEITVTLKQSGTLTPYIVDENGKGLEGATFFIENYSDYYLVEELTDATGSIEPIKLIQGVYFCNASIPKDKFIYQDTKLVQVIADENTKVELKPFENAGNLSAHIVNYNSDLSIADLNVALVQDYYYNIDKTIANACLTKKVGSTGKVSFENIPVGDYYLFVYNDSKSFYEAEGRIEVIKKESIEYKMYIYYWEDYNE